MSIAGGIHLAFDRLNEIQGSALQIFTTNHRRWRLGKLSAREVELFRYRWEENGGIPVAAHDIYLINLAARDELDSFQVDCRFCRGTGALRRPWDTLPDNASGRARG